MGAPGPGRLESALGQLWALANIATFKMVAIFFVKSPQKICQKSVFILRLGVSFFRRMNRDALGECPNLLQIPKLTLLKALFLGRSRDLKIGVTGFEPATSASRTQRSDQAELHPGGLKSKF